MYFFPEVLEQLYNKGFFQQSFFKLHNMFTIFSPC